MGWFGMWLIIKLRAHIDVTWQKFTIESSNVRLALATNGVNPFSEKNNGLLN
jgi:hypothetical protein